MTILSIIKCENPPVAVCLQTSPVVIVSSWSGVLLEGGVWYCAQVLVFEVSDFKKRCYFKKSSLSCLKGCDV